MNVECQLRKSQKLHIKQVVAVLFSAVACAGLLAGVMLYQYGPTGRYVAGAALLSPDVMQKINYKDSHLQTGKGVSFTFNSVEFSYFDPVDHQQKTTTATPEAYQKLYNLIANSQSLPETTNQVIQEFEPMNKPATLMITMRTDVSDVSKPVTKVFQLVQFSNTDHFRIQLRGTEVTGQWAYFYHPQIFQEAIRLLSQPQS